MAVVAVSQRERAENELKAGSHQIVNKKSIAYSISLWVYCISYVCLFYILYIFLLYYVVFCQCKIIIISVISNIIIYTF